MCGVCVVCVCVCVCACVGGWVGVVVVGGGTGAAGRHAREERVGCDGICGGGGPSIVQDGVATYALYPCQPCEEQGHIALVYQSIIPYPLSISGFLR